jgi:hypothetical protein
MKLNQIIQIMKRPALDKKALFRALQDDQIKPEKMVYLLGGEVPGAGDGDGDRPGDGPWNP